MLICSMLIRVYFFIAFILYLFPREMVLGEDYLNMRWQMDKVRPNPFAVLHAPQDCVSHFVDFEKCPTCFRVVASETTQHVQRRGCSNM